MRNWLLSQLRLRTERVELRWPTQEDLDELADRAIEGVHDPGTMPFFSQWTDGDAATVARRVLQRHWASLASWSAQDWTLYLVVVHEGEIVGAQGLGAQGFPTLREALVSAWLGQRHQGRGLGSHARAALLHLAFEGLGAEHVLSVIQQSNLASQGVARKMGFAHDGLQRNTVRGAAVVSDRFRLQRAAWERRRTIDVEMDGLADALAMFGLERAADGSGEIRIAQDAPSTAFAAVDAQQLSGIRYVPESDATTD